MRDKLELTRKLVSQLPSSDWSVDQARVAWWYNFRENGGMRLTLEGYNAFVTELDLECYEFSISEKTKFTQRTVLELDRRLNMPYYIQRDRHRVRKLFFFSSQEAVLANLYGDLEKFLQNYS